MHHRTLLYIGFLLVTLLWVLNLLALKFYFYWIYWWYDGMMHFFAGVAGSFPAYWVLFLSGLIFTREFRSQFMKILIVFVCVMIAGIAWEVFEYANGITDSHEGYPLDPILDLILDGLGALLGAYICDRKSSHV